MCLDMLWTIKRVNEWLKTQPENITAYKVVKIYEGEAYPPIFNSNHGKYRKTNKVKQRGRIPIEVKISDEDMSMLSRDKRPYKTYYHLFLTQLGADVWKSSYREVVLECIIPKEAITDVGLQKGSISIITKEFTFTEGDKYFKEEKRCA